MLPWIMLGASLLKNAQAKKDEKRQALEDLMIGRAQSLGADTTPLRAYQAKRQIDSQPMVDPGLLASAIGSTVQSESVDDRLAKEMAKRGLMKGYQPFDQESGDPEGDMAAAVRQGQTNIAEIAAREEERRRILAGLNGGGGFGGYFGGGR
jgi:hypothetical protein